MPGFFCFIFVFSDWNSLLYLGGNNKETPLSEIVELYSYQYMYIYLHINRESSFQSFTLIFTPFDDFLFLND